MDQQLRRTTSPRARHDQPMEHARAKRGGGNSRRGRTLISSSSGRRRRTRARRSAAKGPSLVQKVKLATVSLLGAFLPFPFHFLPGRARSQTKLTVDSIPPRSPARPLTRNQHVRSPGQSSSLVSPHPHAASPKMARTKLSLLDSYSLLASYPSAS
jgi:hypothetical protein